MKFDPKTTALLTLDYQHGIFNMVESARSILPAAVKAVNCARAKDLHLIHVGLGFSPGHPEAPQGESRFAQLRKAGLFVKGSESATFEPSIVLDGDMVIYKHRISAFTENSLDLVLRSSGVRHLVLCGIATSGIVLSTLRQAFDLDYDCTVLKDACFDRDEEVHRVLTEKVFAGQARVITVDQFVHEQT